VAPYSRRSKTPLQNTTSVRRSSSD
jgi:hypothetical protein